MGTQQLTLPGEIVKKDNRLVRSKLNISSVDASRILANLVACIHTDDKSLKRVYRVAVKDFLTDTSGRGYTRVKGLCRELAQVTVELEEPDPDGPHPIFEIGTIFSRIVYKKGIVEAEFNGHMAPFLLDLQQCFTQYSLTEYLKLPSVYSQRIFEILKSWSGKPEVILPVSELHRLLDSPDSFQANFAEFRRRVLEKAHKDITEKTSFRYEWEPVKIGRSVEKIRFIFSSKKLPLAQKDQEKAKEEKRQRLTNQRFLRAVECARAKGGDCRTMDNVRIVCKLCREKGICASIK
jgi:plasmid replication initiation protein|uniref:Initiator Rep protein WH1 domain-containing protein n=1 Tax=uncultured prokaryote TaxID=198431 RepID=A0A0H5PW83_9ZZZZ|nr:unnamed protein product [uncultured bacterium]CRY93823.1 hypothetical protein [uncultured prokaryote]